MLTSTLCRHADFHAAWFEHWSRALGMPLPSDGPPAHLRRKVWEWCVIAQALDERDMLRPGRRGCGFAVGREPLASAFAARGADVIATDQPPGGSSGAWDATGEHAASRDALWSPDVCTREAFDQHVAFRPIDMRDLAPLAGEQFDFVWSSCSFEHLGSLEAGLRFVETSTDLLKPGGVAVHTTEFNVSSDAATLESGDAVVYRRQDLDRLDRRLRLRCAGLERLDLDAGADDADLTWDHAPFFENDRPHLKLVLGGHVCTSVMLIIRQGGRPAAPVWLAEAEPPRHAAGQDMAALSARLTELEAQAAELRTQLATLASPLAKRFWRR